MSALMDALLYGRPLSHVLQQEAREVDAEFRRRYVQSHPEEFSQAEVSAVLGAAFMPLVKAAQQIEGKETP